MRPEQFYIEQTQYHDCIISAIGFWFICNLGDWVIGYGAVSIGLRGDAFRQDLTRVFGFIRHRYKYISSQLYIFRFKWRYQQNERAAFDPVLRRSAKAVRLFSQHERSLRLPIIPVLLRLCWYLAMVRMFAASMFPEFRRAISGDATFELIPAKRVIWFENCFIHSWLEDFSDQYPILPNMATAPI